MLAYLERVAAGTEASFLCRRRREGRFGFAWHFHPEFELTRILRGRGRRFVGDSLEAYGEGDLVLLGPNLPHTWQSEGRGPHEALFCQFRGDFLGPAFWSAPELRRVRALLSRARRGLRFPAAEGRGFHDLDRLPPSRRLLGLLDVLDGLARSHRAVPLVGPGYVPAADAAGGSSRLEAVCREAQERFSEDFRLPEAARLAHLSVPAFSRAFRRATGKTFVAYLSELRIGAACRELIETERPVSDIALDAGFRNLSNFNRRFLRLKGCSPRAFRVQYREADSVRPRPSRRVAYR
jgi:AraC-like DNA-binding protein